MDSYIIYGAHRAQTAQTQICHTTIIEKLRPTLPLAAFSHWLTNASHKKPPQATASHRGEHYGFEATADSPLSASLPLSRRPTLNSEQFPRYIPRARTVFSTANGRARNVARWEFQQREREAATNAHHAITTFYTGSRRVTDFTANWLTLAASAKHRLALHHRLRLQTLWHRLGLVLGIINLTREIVLHCKNEWVSKN